MNVICSNKGRKVGCDQGRLLSSSLLLLDHGIRALNEPLVLERVLQCNFFGPSQSLEEIVGQAFC